MEATTAPPARLMSQDPPPSMWQVSPYEQWVQSTGVPVHRGYFVPDVRSVEVGPWEERGCNAAFLVLSGLEGVTEARVTEIEPGATTRPVRFGLDELVYVAEGRGLTTVSTHPNRPSHTFEWQKHSLFVLPRDCSYQLTNAQGGSSARLLHYSYLPTALATIPDPEFFLDPVGRAEAGPELEFYSEAKMVHAPGTLRADTGYWFGSFFPDLRAWDRFHAQRIRGAGSSSVRMAFPHSVMWASMAIFPPETYKKAHRHGPGVVIVIPAGEGFSVMWQEGKEKIFCPWQEGSVFVPPNRWFHQHFNVGGEPARYLKLHAPRGINRGSERIEDLARDQIEYPDEDPWIRAKFDSELTKRRLSSAMPEAAYRDREYQWAHEWESEDD